MKDLKLNITAPIKLFTKAMLLSFALFFICRLIFHIHNYHSFKSLGLIGSIKLYYYALLFDSSAIALCNVLFLLVLLLPLPNSLNKVKAKVAGILFLLFNSVAVVFNLFDAAYFPFTNKRLTIDMLGFAGNNGNILELIPQFLVSYWYLVIVLIVIIIFLYKWTAKNIFTYAVSTKYLPKVVAFISNTVLLIGLLLLMFRGWFQNIPLGIVDANKYAAQQNTPLLLNTVFTVSKSIGTDVINEYHFYNEKDVVNYYNPVTTPSTTNKFNNKNVVIIMVESLSKEFMGSQSNLPTHTPFLDSLSKHSLVFTDAYANGKQSIQGIPAVVASMPSIMNGYFINTPYTNDKFNGLGTLLSQKGYYTAFMHGAHNGSMNFDAFAKQAGYKDYLGRTEYNNDKDFDGDWGIWDEEFLQFAAQKMTACKQPFHFAIFTLSSHNPYQVPKRYQQKFKTVYKNPLLRVIEYTDFALQQFFETAKKQSWYNNTLFVITADHTGESLHPFYSNFVGQYQVPIIFFDPQQNQQQLSFQTTSQADIMPNVLHYLQYNQPYFSFGNDGFSTPSFAVFYTNNQYQITQNGFVLSFDGTKSTSLYHFTNDSLLQTNLLSNTQFYGVKQHLERTVKAYIQQYNNRIVENKLLP